MDIIDRIRRQQKRREIDLKSAPLLDKLFTLLKHTPEIYYTGCVDARLDPIGDIGFMPGDALISRRYGALVQEAGDVEFGATMEHFLHRVSLEPDKKKHIIIAGHTNCGALGNCMKGVYAENEPNMRLYLEGNLKAVRDRLVQKAKLGGWDEDRTLHELEKASVCQSIARMLRFPGVQQAIDDGRLEVHGWVLDTANKRIYEMDIDDPLHPFEPMGKKRNVQYDGP